MALMLMIAFLLTSVVPTLTSTKRKRERSANSCRDCSGGRLCEKKCKSLAKLRPIIASEWHPTENGDLNPDDVSVGSHKKVWWQCPNPCDVCGELHDYSAYIYGRTNEKKPRSCPICSSPPHRQCHNKCKSLAMAKEHSDIASQWHPTKNRDSPKDVFVSSNKKVWWQCPNPCDECQELHDYSATINNRTFNQTGCPVCSSPPQQQCHNKCKSLAKVLPTIASQWHPTKNRDSPKDVFVSSNKKVWWQCPNPCDECQELHDYSATINNRTSNQSCCPVCSSPPKQQCQNKCKSLAKIHPDIASEWHPKKNGDLTPSDVSVGSSKKVWWIKECKADVFHEWPAVVHSRTKLGTGCPRCNESKGENAIRNTVKTMGVSFLPQVGLYGHHNQKLKFDFGLLPEPSAYLEYDGEYHFTVHYSYKNRVKVGVKRLEESIARDREKDDWIVNNGYTLLRIHFNDFDNIDFIVRDFIENLDRYKGSVVRSPNYVDCCVEELKTLLEQSDE